MPEPVGPGGLLAPQYFEDQLTLFEHGRADYPHLLLLPPPQCFSPSGMTSIMTAPVTEFQVWGYKISMNFIKELMG